MKAADVIATIQEAIQGTAFASIDSAFEEFVKANPEDKAAFDKIMADLNEKAVALQAGTGTISELKFAGDHAVAGISLLAAAKKNRALIKAGKDFGKILAKLVLLARAAG